MDDSFFMQDLNNKKIRVLHVMGDPFVGSTIIPSLFRYQLQLGYHVEVASGEGEYLHKLRLLNIPVTNLPISRKFMEPSHIAVVHHLHYLIKKRGFHIIHAHNVIGAFLGRLAASIAKTPIIIYHMHGSLWESNNLLVRSGFTFLERLAGKWTTHTFTINHSDTEDLIQKRIMPRKCITTLTCGGVGINTQHFDPKRIHLEHKLSLRTELNIRSSDFVIGFVGRIVREKGVFELLEAFEMISRKIAAKLLIIGGNLSSERDQDSIQLLIEKTSDLTKNVIFTGFREDIAELIAIMNVLVLPSYREGFGLVLAESGAMGCPVIASATRGGKQAVIHGRNGLLVPPKDVKAIQDAILYLAHNPQICAYMGKEGRDIAIEKFDEKIVLGTIQKKYEELLIERGLR